MATPTSFARPTAELLALRPAIEGQLPASPTPTAVADFQHRVLRPILKFQHQVLLVTVADFAREYRLPLSAADTEINSALGELLTRNTRLRALLTGLVVGLLTQEELAFYRQHRNELNRRLLDLAQQRVLSSLTDLRRAAEQ